MVASTKHIARSIAVVGSVLSATPLALAEGLPRVLMGDQNPVPSCATPERLMVYLRSRNPRLDRRYATIAAEYRRHGEAARIRWDYAFFQMIVETASLTYRRPDGTPARVRADLNNFAGLGVRETGAPERFADVETGVAAHVRRLARISRLKGDFEDLARVWSPRDEGYASSLESVARRFADAHCAEDDEPSAPVASKAPRPASAAMAVASAEGRSPSPAKPSSPPKVVPPTAVKQPQAERGAATASRPEEPAEPAPRAADASSGTDFARQAMARAEARVDRRLAGLGVGEPAEEAEHRVPRAGGAIAALPPPRPPSPAPARDPADEAVLTLVSGQTVLLDTPVGTQIPIAFAEDGTMKGETKSLGWYLGAVRDEGKWWVNRGRLCQRWKVWFDRELQCLTLRPQGAVIHWSTEQGKQGTARIAPKS